VWAPVVVAGWLEAGSQSLPYEECASTVASVLLPDYYLIE
jgi:hypothetical protein